MSITAGKSYPAFNSRQSTLLISDLLLLIPVILIFTGDFLIATTEGGLTILRLNCYFIDVLILTGRHLFIHLSSESFPVLPYVHERFCLKQDKRDFKELKIIFLLKDLLKKRILYFFRKVDQQNSCQIILLLIKIT